ncbi:MAG TPA: HDIG domain-containing protein [Melioribacteraceae bacterium]|nr:HDIG domain-containing protein [Melioribacteraceae bacterium]
MDKHFDREYCLSLLHEYTKGISLRKHAYAVELCMKEYAIKFNEDPNYWGNVGLLHDFDYEKFPTTEEHPVKGGEILTELGFEKKFIDSILSHCERTGVKRDSLMRKVLFAVDELSGFITAVALVRPSKLLAEVDVKSVRKKMKDKAFAKQVSREDIINGALELNIDLDEHIRFCINALQKGSNLLEL